MEKTEKIDIRQRERLLDVVQSARKREETRLKQLTLVSESTLIRDLARTKGASAIVKEMNDLDDQISKLKDGLHAREEKLHNLGFEYRNLQLQLRWDAPDALRQFVAKKLDEAYKPVDMELKPFDLAIAKVWTASTPSVLLQAVEGLI
jgi:hypothetical protein